MALVQVQEKNELPHELPNHLRLSILGNWEILERSPGL